MIPNPLYKRGKSMNRTDNFNPNDKRSTKPATPKQINARQINWYRLQLKGTITQLRKMNNEVNNKDYVEVLYLIHNLKNILKSRLDAYSQWTKNNLKST